METSFRFENAPFTISGTTIKACFHCHTINSDGGMSPEETSEIYYKRGFKCLGITDHRQVTRIECMPGDDFTAIGATENGGTPDIIGVGVYESVDKDLTLHERVKLLSAQGGFTIAAHPTYEGVFPQTYADCGDLMAMEIYNAYCDAAYANGYALELWDMVLGLGKRIWGVAGDDAHLNRKKIYYSDAGLGWVEIWSDTLDHKCILGALKNGKFFSTQGPVFKEIMVRERSVSLKCSPVKQVRWRTYGKTGYVDYASEKSCLTSSSLPEWFLPNKYIRIELVDSDGKKAWSNPIFCENKA